MDPIVVRVTNRHLVRLAVAQAWPKVRVASIPELTPEVVVAFVEPFYAHRETVAGLGGIVAKVGKLLDLFRKAPGLWEKFKGLLGLPEEFESLGFIEKGKVLAGKLKDWAASGWATLKKVFHQVRDTFPLAMFFSKKDKMPGLTDLLENLIKKVPWLQRALASVNKGIGRVDAWFDKYLPTLKRPLLGAIFAWVWFNVAEISWDLQFLFRGFTGGISLGELFGSLPESAIGLVAASFGLGYGALPVTLIARVMWLAANHYLEWVPGRGLRVRWDRLGIEDGEPAMVAV